MTTISPDVDALWQDFHSVVNMSSRELRDWLFAEAASEGAESLPELIAEEAPMGARVLEILGKRKTDLTGRDVATMRDVVEFVHDVRGDEIEGPVAYDEALRHQLMDTGHDPLKPTSGG